MSFMVAPPGHRNGHDPEGDDVDQLLRAFYRSEMPDPFPSFEAPAETLRVLPFPVPAARRPRISRSRLALAASVALLMGGFWSLSGKLGTGPTEPTGLRVIDDGSATRVHPGANSEGRSKGPFIVGGELQVIIEGSSTGPGR